MFAGTCSVHAPEKDAKLFGDTICYRHAVSQRPTFPFNVHVESDVTAHKPSSKEEEYIH